MKKRRTRLSDSETLQRTAVHESGHAVMTIHFGFPLAWVTIESDGFNAGVTFGRVSHKILSQHPDALFAIEKEIIVLMAGVEAEKSVLPKLAGPPWGDDSDQESIDIWIRDMCAFTRESERSAKRRLRHKTGWYLADLAIKHAIIDVANELLESKTMRKTRVNKFIKQTLDRYYREYYPTMHRRFV